MQLLHSSHTTSINRAKTRHAHSFTQRMKGINQKEQNSLVIHPSIYSTIHSFIHLFSLYYQCFCLLITLSLCDCIVLLHNKIIIKKKQKKQRNWQNGCQRLLQFGQTDLDSPGQPHVLLIARVGELVDLDFVLENFSHDLQGGVGRRETKGNSVRGNKQFHRDRWSLLEVSPRCSRLFTRRTTQHQQQRRSVCKPGASLIRLL